MVATPLVVAKQIGKSKNCLSSLESRLCKKIKSRPCSEIISGAFSVATPCFKLSAVYYYVCLSYRMILINQAQQVTRFYVTDIDLAAFIPTWGQLEFSKTEAMWLLDANKKWIPSRFRTGLHRFLLFCTTYLCEAAFPKLTPSPKSDDFKKMLRIFFVLRFLRMDDLWKNHQLHSCH